MTMAAAPRQARSLQAAATRMISPALSLHRRSGLLIGPGHHALELPCRPLELQVRLLPLLMGAGEIPYGVTHGNISAGEGRWRGG